MTSDNFCFYLQNRLFQTSLTGGQWYSDTSPFSFPWSVCPSKVLIFLSVHLSKNSGCLSALLSLVHLFTCLTHCPYVYRSTPLSVHISTFGCICSSVSAFHLSVSLPLGSCFVYLCAHPSVPVSLHLSIWR